MATHTAHEILGIGNEHSLIVGVRAIHRVSQPEVLPDHDAVLVASFI